MDDSIDKLFAAPMGPRKQYELLDAIGVLVSERARARFKDQKGPGNVRWEERAVPNIAGMIRDLVRSPGRVTFPARRFESTPALVDTGRLRQSIEHRVDVARGEVEVGSALPYAARMQEGGEEFIRATPEVAGGLINAANRGEGKRHRKALITAAKEISNTGGYLLSVPSREFLGFDRGEDLEILNLVVDVLWSD